MAYSDVQHEFIKSTEPRIVLQACAGSGKTTALLDRVEHIIRSGEDPKSILCLTFTNNAAAEMCNRYRTNHSTTDGVFVTPDNMPNFSTFHGFVYRLICNNPDVRAAIGYESVPNLIDDTDYDMYLKSASRITGISMGIKKLRNEVQCRSVESVDRDIVLSCAHLAMAEDNNITFDMLLRKVTDLFVMDHESVAAIKGQISNILVDEFQDTDPYQWEFIQSFHDSNLVVIGDIMQSIYQFRGADSSIMKQLIGDPRWKLYTFDRDYRSTGKICRFINEVVTKYQAKEYRIGDQDYIAEIISGTNICGDTPRIICYKDDRIRTSNILPCVLESILYNSRKPVFNTSAILCRTNREVRQICDMLTCNNVPHLSKTSLNDMDMIWKSVFDDEVAFRYGESLLDDKQLFAATQWSNLEEFYNMFSHCEHFESRIRKILNLRSILNQPHSTWRSMIDVTAETVLTILGAVDGAGLDDQSKMKADSYTYLHRDVKDALRSFVDDYINGIIGRLPVYVGTIHSVKGSEFSSVAVVGVDSSSFRINSEENLHLLYVAMSRARRSLTLYKQVYEDKEGIL